MVYLPGHELHDVEVVRAEACDEGEQDEEDNGVGPVVPRRSAGHRALPGRGPQLQVDPGVASHDGDERTPEGDGTGQEQEVRGEAGALEVKVLHAGPPLLALAQHAAEQQGGHLQGDQSPDQAADPADNPHTP